MARHALVIGNGAYEPQPLRNPRNDAEAIAAALGSETIGFSVTKLVDADIYAIDDAITKFIGSIAPDDTALFFFAGHAVELPDKINYLISVDARITNERQVHKFAISLDEIARQMSQAAKCSLIFLDACRDNPFADLPASSFGSTRSLTVSGERARSKTAGKTFWAFSTSSEKTAYDGRGANSPFTAALLRHIETPGLEIHKLLQQVRNDVEAETDGIQISPALTTLGDDFFFVEAKADIAALDWDPPPVNALSADLFTDDPAEFHCLVVLAELPPAESKDFYDHVWRALANYPVEIEQAVLALRRTRHRTDPADTSSVSMRLSVLRVEDAFAHPDTLGLAVRALCRADAAIFDITDYQPGTMLLLGVRAVGRRGVTICSNGREYHTGDGFHLPFNLQMLNIVAHVGKAGNDDSADPAEIIARKLIRGLHDLAALPDYMDLPAYDPVRTLSPAGFRPISMNEKVLILCPFTETYLKNNWPLLRRELPPQLVAALLKQRKESGGNPAERRTERPTLIRLLDDDTPRLVAQTLYELIRRVQMCVIDWTALRANVMFELGVRLAVNRLGAIHICDTEPVDQKQAQAYEGLEHVKLMKSHFTILQYSSARWKREQFGKMVERFVVGLGKPPSDEQYRAERLMDFLVYEAVGATAVDDRRDPFAPVVDELVERSRVLANEDDRSRGMSSVLYCDVVPAIRDRARAAARERRVAAWLYLDARYSASEIKANAELWQLFWTLGQDARGWFGDGGAHAEETPGSHRTATQERIAARLKEIGRPPFRPQSREGA